MLSLLLNPLAPCPSTRTSVCLTRIPATSPLAQTPIRTQTNALHRHGHIYTYVHLHAPACGRHGVRCLRRLWAGAPTCTHARARGCAYTLTASPLAPTRRRQVARRPHRTQLRPRSTAPLLPPRLPRGDGPPSGRGLRREALPWPAPDQVPSATPVRCRAAAARLARTGRAPKELTRVEILQDLFDFCVALHRQCGAAGPDLRLVRAMFRQVPRPKERAPLPHPKPWPRSEPWPLSAGDRF